MTIDIGAIIFDLDGLVLDTEVTYFSAWRQAANEMGYRLSAPFCKSLSGLHHGAVERKITDLYGKDFDLESFNRLSGIFWRHFVQTNGIRVKPGFHDLLEVVRRLQWPYCLATNSRLKAALECLALAGLSDIFPVIAARDHVSHGKPAPDIFRFAAARLGIEISRCLALEDSPAGILAAKEAGAFAVFVPSVLPPDGDTSARSDKQCRDLNEVAQWLRLNRVEVEK